MKFLFTTLLIVSYIAIGLFGFFDVHANTDMNMQSHNTPINCIAATVNGVDCPEQTSPIDFATFHIDAFKSFSLATLTEGVSNVLPFAFIFLFFIDIAFFTSYLLRLPRLAFYRHRFSDYSFSPQKQKFTRWLAIHENSPALF